MENEDHTGGEEWNDYTNATEFELLENSIEKILSTIYNKYFNKEEIEKEELKIKSQAGSSKKDPYAKGKRIIHDIHTVSFGKDEFKLIFHYDFSSHFINEKAKESHPIQFKGLSDVTCRELMNLGGRPTDDFPPQTNVEDITKFFGVRNYLVILPSPKSQDKVWSLATKNKTMIEKNLQSFTRALTVPKGNGDESQNENRDNKDGYDDDLTEFEREFFEEQEYYYEEVDEVIESYPSGGRGLATTLLSALTSAMNNTGFPKLPLFVPFRPPIYDAYIGSCYTTIRDYNVDEKLQQHGKADKSDASQSSSTRKRPLLETIQFETDVRIKVPESFKYLSDHIRSFKEKVIANTSLHRSIRFQKKLGSVSDFDVIVSVKHSWVVYIRTSATYLSYTYWGPKRDPLRAIQVSALWPSFKEGTYIENESQSTLLMNEAPLWNIRCVWVKKSKKSTTFTSNDDGRLYIQMKHLFKLLKISLGLPHQDTIASVLLTKEEKDFLESKKKTLERNQSKIQRVFNKAKDDSSSNESSTSSVNEESIPEPQQDEQILGSVPKGSILEKLLMQILPDIDCYSSNTLGLLAHSWTSFCNDVRWYWENEEMIPINSHELRSPEEILNPPLYSSLLHQKLELLNICIGVKKGIIDSEQVNKNRGWMTSDLLAHAAGGSLGPAADKLIPDVEAEKALHFLETISAQYLLKNIILIFITSTRNLLRGVSKVEVPYLSDAILAPFEDCVFRVINAMGADLQSGISGSPPNPLNLPLVEYAIDILGETEVVLAKAIMAQKRIPKQLVLRIFEASIPTQNTIDEKYSKIVLPKIPFGNGVGELLSANEQEAARNFLYSYLGSGKGKELSYVPDKREYIFRSIVFPSRLSREDELQQASTPKQLLSNAQVPQVYRSYISVAPGEFRVANAWTSTI